MTQPKSAVDVLLDQHEHIRKLLDEVAGSFGAQRANAWAELRRMLAIHEAAEEILTHPAVKQHGGAAVVEQRLDEEQVAKRMLVALDRLDPDSREFAEGFPFFRSAVLEHADAEERFEFPLLTQTFSPAELDDMGAALKKLEKVAPTRPHPRVGESAVANIIATPFATLLDRARDKVADVLGKR